MCVCVDIFVVVSGRVDPLLISGYVEVFLNDTSASILNRFTEDVYAFLSTERCNLLTFQIMFCELTEQ